MSCHFLLQGIFPTPGSNPGLLHCRQIRYHLSHQGRPKPTALDLPRQSPIQVLIRPDPAELPRSDEIRCVQGGIAIAELPGNPYNSQGSNNSFHNCLKEIIIWGQVQNSCGRWCFQWEYELHLILIMKIHIWELAYSLKFICIPEINTQKAFQGIWEHRANGEKWRCARFTLPAKVKEGHALPSWLSSSLKTSVLFPV